MEGHPTGEVQDAFQTTAFVEEQKMSQGAGAFPPETTLDHGLGYDMGTVALQDMVAVGPGVRVQPPAMANQGSEIATLLNSLPGL